VTDAPNTLAVRCRGPHTELLLGTETWRATRASEVQVDYQINDQPFVRLQWTVSAGGKTVSYKDDAVGLLRSLPEGARLKISVFDRQGLGQKRRSNSPDWIASGRKLDWHVSGHRQQTKCHQGNDEPQLCTCCNRESTVFSISLTSDRLELYPLF
jgi:hypothetical protein